ncbi:MAG: hemerythrin domain-containing protein [Acidobacteriota bacterium]
MSLTPASDSLRAEHRRIEAYLDQLLAAVHQISEARLAGLRECSQAIGRLAAVHFRREEQVLFPRLRQAFPELPARMEEQHEYARQIERSLDEMLAPGVPLDAERMAELRRFGLEFHAALQHHIIEEEDYLLRLADSELSEAEQQALADAMGEVAG